MTDVDDGVQIVSSLTDEYAFKYDTVELDFDKSFVDRYTGINIDSKKRCMINWLKIQN